MIRGSGRTSGVLGSLALAALALAASLPGSGRAEEARELVVGTHGSAPFAMQDPDGRWRGISIELWQLLAHELGLTYRFEERPLEGLLAGLHDGSLDVVAAALTTTEEREILFDFTQPYFLSGLAIGVRFGERKWLTLRSFLSGEFARIAGLVLAGVVAASLAILAFERRRNPEHFGGSGWRGLGEALWWAAVTMTTVGYGDRTPRSVAGRVVAVIWMLAGVMLISAFTATIASNLTVEQIGGSISGPADLPGHRVATVRGSTSEDYLESRGIAPLEFDDAREAVRALMEGRADAVVYDEPILRHIGISEPEVSMHVLPFALGSQAYAFGLQEASPVREQLDRAILGHIVTGDWRTLVAGYVGD